MVRPPLKDVAALADVSEPTVSRVLNGRPGVARPTRERVIRALASLGYTDVPEPRATRRDVVGIVCGEFSNPVFPTLVHHIGTELGRKGYVCTVAVTDPDLAPEERCITELVESGVDGYVLVGGRHAEVGGELEHYRELVSSGAPVVLVNGAATELDVTHVICDEGAGARQAVSHLVALGHTRIGCLLGSARFVPTGRFLDGYRHTMREAGLVEPEGAVVEAAFTYEGGRAGAARLLDRGMTAVIAGNDLMALGALHAAAGGHGGPSGLSVVGYDGTDLTAFTAPKLTTLRQPFAEMATHVALAVTSELDGSTAFRDQYVFEPSLVLGDSTHAARATPAVAGR
jgi:DNA-binding LacI/PurR family transcriptional regulator